MLRDPKRLGDIVQIADQTPAQSDRLRIATGRLRALLAHLPQPAAQRFVNGLLHSGTARVSEALQQRRHIWIQGQRCAHASEHKRIDVLTSKQRVP